MSDIDPYEGDVNLTSPPKKCTVCGQDLSRYNTLGFCFRHLASMKERKEQTWQERRVRPTIEMILGWCIEEDQNEFLEYLGQEGLKGKPKLVEELNEMQKILAEGNSPLLKRDLASVEKIMELVCDEFGLTSWLILQKNRSVSLVLARHVLMYLLYIDTSLSYPEIGEQLGGRDHTTVMHGVEKITGTLTEGDKELQKRIDRVRSHYKPDDNALRPLE